tara:strand:+ start:717 stop:890 length:174 start_codon:yes stop_codon:yes gene_type:complete
MNINKYIKLYILPNESKNNIINYYNNNLEYDKEYLKEHILYNSLLTKKIKNKLIKTL